mmetsp:Transcript_9199/g.14928  ORF Transcript_9199/g.14928 Transcript_9199/m.14928 type:complete len:415 (-) Transcript_9199:14-1258(-)
MSSLLILSTLISSIQAQSYEFQRAPFIDKCSGGLAGVYSDGSSTTIHYLGGWCYSNSAYLDTSYTLTINSFDLSTTDWQQTASLGQVVSCDADCATSIDNKLYIAIEWAIIVYDMAQQTYLDAETITVSNTNYQISGGSSLTNNGSHLFAIGGGYSCSDANVYAYSFAANTWHELSMMPNNVASPGCTLDAARETIYCFGGYDVCGNAEYVGYVQAYNLLSDEWTLLSGVSLSVGRSKTHALLDEVSGDIYVVTGQKSGYKPRDFAVFDVVTQTLTEYENALIEGVVGDTGVVVVDFDDGVDSATGIIIVSGDQSMYPTNYTQYLWIYDDEAAGNGSMTTTEDGGSGLMTSTEDGGSGSMMTTEYGGSGSMTSTEEPGIASTAEGGPAAPDGAYRISLLCLYPFYCAFAFCVWS